MNLRNDVAARHQAKIDNFSYDFTRHLCVWKSAERDENFHSLGSNERLTPAHRLASANPPAANHNIAVIQNGCLSRRDRALRLMQSNARTIRIERCERRACPGMAVANLDVAIDCLGSARASRAGLGASPRQAFP